MRRDSRSASPSRDRERDGRDRHADRHEREARRKGSDAEDEEGKEAGAAKEMPGTRGMTESEKRFLEVQRQRVSGFCVIIASRAMRVDTSGVLGYASDLGTRRVVNGVELTEQRAERVAKGAHLTHKDRVTEFNTKLDKLTYVDSPYPSPSARYGIGQQFKLTL